MNIISGSESRLRGSQEFLDIQEGEGEEDEEENDDFQPLPCFSGARDKDMDKVFLFDYVLKKTNFSFCLLLLCFLGYYSLLYPCNISILVRLYIYFYRGSKNSVHKPKTTFQINYIGKKCI
jgi:hypothetical protein